MHVFLIFKTYTVVVNKMVFNFSLCLYAILGTTYVPGCPDVDCWGVVAGGFVLDVVLPIEPKEQSKT